MWPLIIGAGLQILGGLLNKNNTKNPADAAMPYMNAITGAQNLNSGSSPGIFPGIMNAAASNMPGNAFSAYMANSGMSAHPYAGSSYMGMPGVGAGIGSSYPGMPAGMGTGMPVSGSGIEGSPYMNYLQSYLMNR